VTTTSAERKALNENAFREANEKLERGAHEIVGAEFDSIVPFLCECPRPECKEVVSLTFAEYERVRADSRQGIAKVGHEDPEIEDVVERNDRFLMTKKFGRAGEVHTKTDPRT
jgi:hypothetical protein